jgi:hypothetical protein
MASLAAVTGASAAISKALSHVPGLQIDFPFQTIYMCFDPKLL